jgi:hypothetical protein
MSSWSGQQWLWKTQVLGFENLGLGLDNCGRTTKNAYCRIYSLWVDHLQFHSPRTLFPGLHWTPLFRKVVKPGEKWDCWLCWTESSVTQETEEWERTRLCGEVRPSGRVSLSVIRSSRHRNDPFFPPIPRIQSRSYPETEGRGKMVILIQKTTDGWRKRLVFSVSTILKQHSGLVETRTRNLTTAYCPLPHRSSVLHVKERNTRKGTRQHLSSPRGLYSSSTRVTYHIHGHGLLTTSTSTGYVLYSCRGWEADETPFT